MKLFDPMDLGQIRLKHRLTKSATWLASASPTGDVTDELISRYIDDARGGSSLLLTGFAYVSPEGAMLPGMIGVENDARVEGLKKLTNAVHKADGDVKFFCQIVHTGIWRLPFVRTTYADTFAADETKDLFIEMGGTGETCPSASEERIQEVIEAWAAGARRCKEAGFDGVELHFAHGFGPSGWFSPLWNHRTDNWGGSRENRARYGIEVLKAVRKAVGKWTVTAKINCEDGIDGGVTLDDAAYFAQSLVNAGIDGLTISGGCPAAGKNGAARLARRGKEGRNGEGYFAEPTVVIRDAINSSIPITSVGGWRTPAIMEKHLDKTCDAFAISRALLNDNGIINKWIEDPEYPSECISCNKCSQGSGAIICRKDEK